MADAMTHGLWCTPKPTNDLGRAGWMHDDNGYPWVGTKANADASVRNLTASNDAWIYEARLFDAVTEYAKAAERMKSAEFALDQIREDLNELRGRIPMKERILVDHATARMTAHYRDHAR